MNKKAQKENIENIVFPFVARAEEPFTVDTLFERTGLHRSAENLRETWMFLRSDDSLVEKNQSFYPKSLFLKNIPIRVLPTEEELKEGIWIPGHRLLPFYPQSILQEGVYFTLKDSGEPLKTKTIAKNFIFEIVWVIPGIAPHIETPSRRGFGRLNGLRVPAKWQNGQGTLNSQWHTHTRLNSPGERYHPKHCHDYKRDKIPRACAEPRANSHVSSHCQQN